jgi:hypothetical protein
VFLASAAGSPRSRLVIDETTVLNNSLLERRANGMHSLPAMGALVITLKRPGVKDYCCVRFNGVDRRRLRLALAPSR